MKYPEAVYKIGNEFKWDSKRRFIYEDHDGKHIYGTDEGMYKHEDVVIVGILAETLAVLARENGERINIAFQVRRKQNMYEVLIMLPRPEQIPVYIMKPSEPTGEFFLRVAKLRKYIT